MKHTLNAILIFLVIATGAVLGQMNDYRYKRSLSGQKELWHSVNIPEDVYGKISKDFSDLRIYGITQKNDTIEAPYILNCSEGSKLNKNVNYKLINRVKNVDGYFYTFEVPEGRIVNRMTLDLGKDNFDLKVKVEGSQNQTEWFTITDNYRIVGLSNWEADYSYTDISFGDSKYQYLRLFVPGNEDPRVTTASLSMQQTDESRFHVYSIQNTGIRKEKNQTLIDLNLGKKLPVSRIRFQINEKIDYYRPIKIEYPIDSIETEMGWIIQYETLMSTELNSLVEHDFHFSSTLTDRLRITIENDANQPLTPSDFEISGFEYSLITRLTEKANYYLVYGSNTVTNPDYDISRFKENIPLDPSVLIIGNEESIVKEIIQTEPIFKNPAWLWGILGTIIALIAWAMFSMMTKVK